MNKFFIAVVFLICVLNIGCKNDADVAQAQAADSEKRSVQLMPARTPIPTVTNSTSTPIATSTYQGEANVTLVNPRASELSYVENPALGEHYKPAWIKPEESSDNGFEPFCMQTMVSGKKAEKCGYQNAKGKVLIKPAFNKVFVFSEGLAGVCPRIDQLCGYINEKGQIVIKANYQSVDVFSEGLAGVLIGDTDYYKYGYLDKKGAIVIKQHYTDGEPFHNGIAKVKLRSLDYCINKKDQEVKCPE